MASNPIGDIPVVISGDFSALSDAIDQAQQAAAAGASSIADAFNKPDIAAGMTASIQALVDASGLAGGALTIFQSVLESDTQAGVDLTQSLTDLAGSASTVGSAVADAAQALLDQQQATLGASDAAIQLAESSDTASQSISDVGSSASTAGNEAEELGGIRQHGRADVCRRRGSSNNQGAGGFRGGGADCGGHDPERYGRIDRANWERPASRSNYRRGQVSARNRAVCFPGNCSDRAENGGNGGCGGCDSWALQAIADTAAATTNSFQSVAKMFDRMTISGTANTRSLATLGISFDGTRRGDEFVWRDGRRNQQGGNGGFGVPDQARACRFSKTR